MKKEDIALLEKIGKEIRIFQNHYKDIYFISRFAMGDQWRNDFWERISLDNIPSRVHNKIIGYKRTLTAYFVQSYPRLSLDAQDKKYKSVVRKLQDAVNAIISDPQNFGVIASAFASSMITGVSVIKFNPLPKLRKVEIQEIPLHNIYTQMGEVNLRKVSYIVERYVALKDNPLRPLTTPRYDQLNLPDTYSIYYAIYSKNEETGKVSDLKIIETGRRQISYDWDTSPLLNYNENDKSYKVISGMPPIDDYPYVLIPSSPDITNMFDYKISEAYAAKDIQIFINKLISYSDLVMGITALGIAKIRNMPATEVELYPGAKIPVPEGSDIAVDRGIGLNFNFEAYNLSSALADDIFGINEILRGVRPQSVTSGVAVNQLYNIALSRLQLKVPMITQMLRRLVVLVAKTISTYDEFRVKFGFTPEDLDLIDELVDNEQFEINATPTIADTRNTDSILDAMIKLAQSGVMPPQVVFDFIRRNYPYFFGEEEIKFSINDLVSKELVKNVGNLIMGGSNMPLGQAFQQQAQAQQVPALSPEGEAFMRSVGIDPALVTPEVIQMALQIMQDPSKQQQIQDMIQKLISQGYTESDAQKFVFALIVKAIIDQMNQAQAPEQGGEMPPQQQGGGQ